MNILGTYSKAIVGSLTVNFARSSGDHCSDLCRFKRNGGCYAAHLESFRSPLRQAAVRRELDIKQWLALLTVPTVLRALARAPWVRFSAFGAMPRPDSLSRDDTDKLHKVADILDHTVTHFPVESPEKLRFYSRLGFHPRLSLTDGQQDLDRAEHTLDRGHSVSLVFPIDRSEKGWMRRAKVLAMHWQRELRKRWPNRKVRVCPAIIGSAKCGDCTLCAHGPKAADVVIYPEHL